MAGILPVIVAPIDLPDGEVCHDDREISFIEAQRSRTSLRNRLPGSDVQAGRNAGAAGWQRNVLARYLPVSSCMPTVPCRS